MLLYKEGRKTPTKKINYCVFFLCFYSFFDYLCAEIIIKIYAYFDECFIADRVTGNASGSFFFNSFAAENAICHNWQLIGEAWDEFCLDAKELARGPEFIDVTLRCYVLGTVIAAIYE